MVLSAVSMGLASGAFLPAWSALVARINLPLNNYVVAATFGFQTTGLASGVSETLQPIGGRVTYGGTGMSGVQMCLYPTYATVNTDSNGYYEFAGLAPGDYSTEEVQQDGWAQSDPSSPETLSAGENDTTGNDFGNYQKGKVNGYKYLDINGDGVRDADGVDDIRGNSDDEAGVAARHADAVERADLFGERHVDLGR